MRLLQESYEALGRYLEALRAEAPGSPTASRVADAIGDLTRRIEPVLAARLGDAVCPGCSRVYPQHAGDAEANARAESCVECLAETGAPRADARLAGWAPWLGARPLVLAFCRECRSNVGAGDADEAGALVCSGCREQTYRPGGPAICEGRPAHGGSKTRRNGREDPEWSP